MRLITVLFCTSMILLHASAHQGHRHAKPSATAPASRSESEAVALTQISRTYESSIKPLFQKACFDCHSNQTAYPWYYRVPGVKNLIDSDIAEAKEHLDLSSGFPFKGHGSPEEDLRAISEAVESGSMPPFLYRVSHTNQKLSDQDRQAIVSWARESRAVLNAGSREESK